MRILLSIVFLLFSHLSYAQLIDPFGKIETHEISLTKLADGSFTGAAEWITAPKDSLQRFVVNGLDINMPVMVRIVSKAPEHNIDLNFYKTDWKTIESTVSTDGEKFADKTFRTARSAGIGIHSDVAGIPYLLIVKTGLKFPVTKSLIRVTDDQEAYARHIKKMGITDDSFTERNNSSKESAGNTKGSSSNNNSTLLYILIGLLTIIILLLLLFLAKKKSSKITTLLILALASSQICVAQAKGPIMVPISGQGDAPVFLEYETQNVANQVPVDYPVVRLEANQGSVKLSAAETKDLRRRMRADSEEFENNYIDNMPGKTTEDGQRIPDSFNQDELNSLRREVRALRQQVELLSQEDEEYDADANSDLNDESSGSQDENSGVLIYCEDIAACVSCLDQSMIKLSARISKFRVLQKFYSSEIESINRKISFGNAFSSVTPIVGVVWQNKLSQDIMPAVLTLHKAYNDKFDQYLESLEAELNFIDECPTNAGTDGIRNKAVRDQAEAILFYYRSTKILN
ncbi:MAG: hypothetical protein Sapg2KO_48300 [Saprospiraceae bacterium]